MSKNLIIHNLEVRFQVDGDDGAVFQRLFNKHIQEWSRLYEAECARAKHTENERKLGDQGLLGMTAPVEHGGGGLSYFDAVLAVEEMAKYDPRSAGEMHTNGTGTASHLWVLGTPEQQERWLRPICEGRLRCAIAMTEPEAGSAATEMTTTATPSEDGTAYCLNGGKIFISGGKHADIFITYARFGDAQDGGKSIGAIVVEKDALGFSILRNDHNMAGEDQALRPAQRRAGDEVVADPGALQPRGGGQHLVQVVGDGPLGPTLRGDRAERLGPAQQVRRGHRDPALLAVRYVVLAVESTARTRRSIRPSTRGPAGCR